MVLVEVVVTVVVVVDVVVVDVVVEDLVVGLAVDVGKTQVVERNGSVTVEVPSSNRFQAGLFVGLIIVGGAAFVASSRMLMEEILPDEWFIGNFEKLPRNRDETESAGALELDALEDSRALELINPEPDTAAMRFTDEDFCHEPPLLVANCILFKRFFTSFKVQFINIIKKLYLYIFILYNFFRI